jgi:5-aminopentanamidase
MVCYDLEFPEWVRLAALAGADLLCTPTNWPREPRAPRLSARPRW